MFQKSIQTNRKKTVSYSIRSISKFYTVKLETRNFSQTKLYFTINTTEGESNSQKNKWIVRVLASRQGHVYGCLIILTRFSFLVKIWRRSESTITIGISRFRYRLIICPGPDGEMVMMKPNTDRDKLYGKGKETAREGAKIKSWLSLRQQEDPDLMVSLK